MEDDLFLEELQMLFSDVRDKRQSSNRYLEGFGLPTTIRMSSETEVELVVEPGQCQRGSLVSILPLVGLVLQELQELNNMGGSYRGVDVIQSTVISAHSMARYVEPHLRVTRHFPKSIPRHRFCHTSLK